mgnify:CR=1 FL=1
MNVVGREGHYDARRCEFMPNHPPNMVRRLLLRRLHGDVSRLLPINGTGKLDWRSIDIIILAIWNIQVDAVCLPHEDIVEAVTAYCPGRMETRPLGGGSAWAASDLDTVGFKAGEALVGEAHF